MNADLYEIIKNDPAFEQYAGRYEEISSDLLARIQIAAWTAEMDKLEIWEARGEARGITIGEARGEAKGIAIGEARGEAKGIAIGEAKGITIGEARGRADEKIESAKRMLEFGISPEDVSNCLELPITTVNSLAAQVKIKGL